MIFVPAGYITGDFETRSLNNLKECGASRYAEDITTEPICFSYDIQPWKVRGTWYPGDPFPAILKKALDAGFWFCAHNVSFEKSIWKYIMVPDFGWPKIPAEQFHDTGALMSMRAMPFALEKALQSLELSEEKDMEGNKLTLSMSKLDKKGYLPIITPAIRQRIGQYCESDISGQVALLNRMGWLPPQERAIWLRSQLANERGIALDLAFVDACQAIVDKATVPLAAEFKKLTGGLAFTQMDKIKKWCASRGVLLPDMTAETLAKLLGEAEDDEGEPGETEKLPLEHDIPPDVRRALHIRQLIGSAAIKKLSRMKQCVNSDGAARYLLQYHGTSPGRQTSRLFQAHNFPRGTIFLKGKDGAQVKPKADGLVAAIMTRDPEYVEMLYGPAVETVVSSLRHAIIARLGRKFVSGDYAGIQARVVLGLAGQHDKTALMAAGADVYCDMASQIYGRTIVKKNQEERQVGKNSVLGLGFGMGKDKFHDKYCPTQPLEFAGHVVDVYRQEWAPKVPDLWHGLENAALDAVLNGGEHEAYGIVYHLHDRWLCAELPGGNTLWYCDPKASKREMPWSTEEQPDWRWGWSYVKSSSSGKRWRNYAFGGLLTENAVMGIERQIIEDAKERCEAEGYPVVLDVHDEILTEPTTAGGNEKVLQQILEDVKPWTKKLQVPIAVDCWEGPRYRK